jgi:DNA transposition AAA+ family ATPase
MTMTKTHTYTDTQRDTVRRIAAVLSSLGLSAAQFASGSGYSASTLSRVLQDRDNDYATTSYAGDVDAVLSSLIRRATALVDQHKASLGMRQATVYETQELLDVQRAVVVARARAALGSEDRLVTYVARSGWGKTTIATHLCREQGGVLVTASPSWRVSYSAMLYTLCEACHVPQRPQGGWGSCAQAERVLLAHLTATETTLHIQELGPLTLRASVLEGLKLLLNRTRCTLVLYVVPEFRGAILRLGGETAAQLLRRGTTITALGVTPSVAQRFLSEHWPDSPAALAKDLARAANEFGGLHLLRSVVDLLADDPQLQSPTASDIAAKVALYRSSHSLAA